MAKAEKPADETTPEVAAEAEATPQAEARTIAPTDEETMALHEAHHAAVIEELGARTVAPEDRDPNRLYFQGVGGVPDGYADTLSEEWLASTEQNNPELYASIQLAIEEFTEAQTAEPKVEQTATEKAPTSEGASEPAPAEGEKEG